MNKKYLKRKRGRKPKVKDVNEEPKKPMKRGRKPKTSTTLANLETYKPPEEAIILHLPINLEKTEFPNGFSVEPKYKKVDSKKQENNLVSKQIIEDIIEERNNLLNSISNKSLMLEFSNCNKKHGLKD